MHDAQDGDQVGEDQIFVLRLPRFVDHDTEQGVEHVAQLFHNLDFGYEDDLLQEFQELFSWLPLPIDQLQNGLVLRVLGAAQVAFHEQCRHRARHTFVLGCVRRFGGIPW